MARSLMLAGLVLACLALPGALGVFGGLRTLRRPLARVSESKNFTAQWVEQPLDHFNPTNALKWNQRFFEEPSFYRTGGPAFIMVEGNDAADTKWITSSFMVDLAKKFKAAVFQLEHRYYGESRPTNDTSTANLVHLTAQQAVADIAHFVQYLKRSNKIESDTKVVLFGGSYAGNLAAWARQKYPHLVYAAVASSAPIELRADFSQYYEMVTKGVSSMAGQWCVDNIRTAMNRAEELLKKTDGIPTVKKVFRACDNLNMTDPDNLNFFFEIMADPFSQAVANNEPTQNGKSNTVADLCENIKGDNLSPDQLMQAYGDMIAKRENVKAGSCIMPYSYPFMVMLMNFVQWGSPTSDRQWTYQTCTQLGLYQTGESSLQPFGTKRFPLSFFSQVCGAAYGSGFGADLMSSGIQATNEEFGGLNPDVTRVIFVHGDSDPWNVLGRKKDLNDDSPAIVIQGTSHCFDMHAPDAKSDSWSLSRARSRIERQLHKFLYGHWPFWLA